MKINIAYQKWKKPMLLCPEEFRDSQHRNGTVHDLILLIEETPFTEIGKILHIRDCLRAPDGETGDKKWWMLTWNRVFLVKSLYNFLNDECLRCPAAKFFWRNWYPRKINFFNWLVWKNTILTLENLGVEDAICYDNNLCDVPFVDWICRSSIHSLPFC